jgi:hypothetical protein
MRRSEVPLTSEFQSPLVSALSVLAQAAAGPLGIADATARNLVVGGLREPRLSSAHASVTAVRHAYERVPASGRDVAVTAAFAWAKAYVASPAFTAAYAAARQNAKPAGLPPEEMTVEAELKKRVDDQRARLAESKQALAAVPASADRAQVMAELKQLEDMLTNPATLKAWRDEIEERRARDTGAVADLVTRWNTTYPAEPRDFVKRQLADFLVTSSRVDFAIPITIIKSPNGAIVGFAAPMERFSDSWIEIECMLAGREMVAAARAASQAWLTELSG